MVIQNFRVHYFVLMDVYYTLELLGVYYYACYLMKENKNKYIMY